MTRQIYKIAMNRHKMLTYQGTFKYALVNDMNSVQQVLHDTNMCESLQLFLILKEYTLWRPLHMI